MNPDEATPDVEETQETPEVNEAPQEQQEASQDTDAPEGQEESDEPSQANEQQEEAEEDIDWSQYVPQVNTAPPVDENGQVDPVQWEQQMMQKLMFQQNEVSAWKQLEQKYPAVRTDHEIRDMIVANRLYEVQKGGKGSLEGAAKRIFDRMGAAENTGRAKQQTNMKVQKSAALEKSTGAKPSGSNPDVRQRIRAGDTNAIHSQLTSWLDSGSI